MTGIYSNELNILMLLRLMKAHNIFRIIVSPGATNVDFVMSVQRDPDFVVFSAPDERSAAYMACGLAAETGEPVALNCTMATASRNYIPGLTEAYYRKLPVLAITSIVHEGKIGQFIPQVIDRRQQLNDIVKLSVQIPIIKSSDDKWAANVKINEALLELRHRGGGPVHINLTTDISREFTVATLPDTRVIRRIERMDEYPIVKAKNVAVCVGAHLKWDERCIEYIDKFCELYNGVVLCDHTSNYNGKYAIHPALVMQQEFYDFNGCNIDLLIHIGEVSGAYFSLNPSEVWRVSSDGVIRDSYKKLTYVFETDEGSFFKRYVELSIDKQGNECEFYRLWRTEYDTVRSKLKDIPFSNDWAARTIIPKLPKDAVLHFGILNSLRTWNHYELDDSILGYANTGGFGIDGCVSTLIGASLANRDKLYFGVVGDLAFFYDMNVLGNRHVSNNFRLLVVNNGKGTEFTNYFHMAAMFGEETNKFIAADGHYGKKSPLLLKHYAEDLGFKYLSASNKEELMQCIDDFVTPNMIDKPILFEIFTDSKDESDAARILRDTIVEKKNVSKGNFRNGVMRMLSEDSIAKIRRIKRAFNSKDEWS